MRIGPRHGQTALGGKQAPRIVRTQWAIRLLGTGGTGGTGNTAPGGGSMPELQGATSEHRCPRSLPGQGPNQV